MAHTKSDKAKLLYEEAKISEAYSLLRKGIANNPKDKRNYVTLAKLLLKEKMIIEAMDVLGQATVQFPLDVMTLSLKARVYFAAGNYRQCYEMIQRIPDYKNNRALSTLLNRAKKSISQKTYNEDGLRSQHNHDFIEESDYVKAYERGIKASGEDYNWKWRIHIGLWVAKQAVKVEGDFIECGVNKGFLSSAIMTYCDWNSQNKRFFLLDTFSGIDEVHVSEIEKADGVLIRNQKKIESGFYNIDVEEVKRNFSEWHNTIIIKGSIPAILQEVTSESVAFLHIDLNNSFPEVASIEFFWDKLTKGALVLLDDYAYRGFLPSKLGMDNFAKKKNIKILSLPTGQGLIIK